MSEFEEKLNSLLSNPEAMSQVMNLAQSLNLGGPGGASPPPGGEGAPPPPPPENTGDPGGAGGGAGGLGDLAGLLGQLDPKLIQRMLPLVGELAGGGRNDERMQLLYALRPFLKPERRDKVDRAARAARMIHVGKKLLQSMGEQNV